MEDNVLRPDDELSDDELSDDTEFATVADGVTVEAANTAPGPAGHRTQGVALRY